MKLFNELFRDGAFSLLDDEVYTPEVVIRLNDVIDIDWLFRNANGIGLEHIPNLIVSQLAAFDMVRGIGQIYLYLLVKTSRHTRCFLVLKTLE